MSGTIQTADIPLYVFATKDGFKVGINVALETGQPYRMYEFDTGGTGFWSAYDPSWWTINPGTIEPGITISYTSGITYTAQALSEPVIFENFDTAGPVISVDSAAVAAIATAEKTKGKDKFDNTKWHDDVKNDIPPLYREFWGDFGMGLGTGNGLFAILPQLSGSLEALSDGFIIDLGGAPASDTPIDGHDYVQVGTLQVGLTPEDIASFPFQISMQGSNSAGVSFPGSGQPTYQELLANGTVAINNDGGSPSFAAPTGIVFDTGAPTTAIHSGTIITAQILEPFLDGGTVGVDIAPGFNFTLSAPGPNTPDWNMSFKTDTTSGVNEVTTETTDVLGVLSGYVNSGLEPFFRGRVMYDVRDGIIGFDPAPCFATGTCIATPSGELPVEQLCPGDLVVTTSGKTQPIVWIGYRAVNCRHHPNPSAVWPVRVTADAFGPGEPARDLLLSPDHAVFRHGVLIPIRHLINDTTIIQTPVNEVTYFHLELERHDIVLANGLAAESYLDAGDRSAFSNSGAAVHLHPQFGMLRWETAACAPLRVHGPEIERVRSELRDRAANMRRAHRAPGA